MMTERAPSLFGKWAQAGVPRKGWTCIDIEDLGSPDLICEMCERQEIRYVHHMQHADYADILSCGCVCAGHMEEDIKGARHREKGMRDAARRRRNWLLRKTWRQLPNQNWTIDAEGFRVTIFRKDGAWSGVISRPSTAFKRFARRLYPTTDEAKLAAFDAITFLRARSV